MNTSAPILPPADTAAFLHLARHPVWFRLFLLRRLPAAFFSGLVVKAVDEQHSAVCVPFRWFTQNPFRSTYFACLSMAAEMSTGLLVLAHAHGRKPPVATLITAIEAKFHKKAVGITTFVCNEGQAIEHTIAQAYITSSPQTISVRSMGYSNSGALVAEFTITWSLKVKA